MRYFILLALSFFLLCCDDDDAVTVPAVVNFSEFAALEGTNLHQATGMFGDEATNSIYLASRQPNPVTGLLAERVTRYSMDGEIMARIFLDSTDFITNRILILDDVFLLPRFKFSKVSSFEFNLFLSLLNVSFHFFNFFSIKLNPKPTIWYFENQIKPKK